MKFIKSFLLKYFIVLVSVVLLVGCGPDASDETTSGNKQSKSGNEEYDLLIWEDLEKSDGIKDAIKKFEEEHGVKIKVVEKEYAQQIEDLRLDGPAGTGPDVLTIPGDQIGTAVTEGLLKELNVSEEEQSIFTEVAMQSQIVDGKVYGLPKAVETTILFYNKDLVSEDELPTTLEEWYEFSKEIVDGETFGFLALFDQIYYTHSVMYPNGGYIFAVDENGNYDVNDIGLNNEGAVTAVEYIKKFYEEGLFPAGIIGEQGIQVLDSLFAEGKAAAVISGPWNLEPFKRAGIDYGVAPLPLLENGERMHAFLGVKSYNVSSYSKNPELAEEFVKFITNEENSKVRYEITQEVPAVASLADDPVVTSNEAAQAVAEQSQHSVLTPNVPEMNQVWEPIDSALQTIATGQADVKEALDQAVEIIRGQIEAHHGGN